MLQQRVKRVASKYGAKKTQVDGIVFASAAEARRYVQLKQLESCGHITDLELQPKFELAPPVKYSNATRTTPALRYFADFAYRDHMGRYVCEDVKGVATDVYKVKRHLMLAIHGIEVVEVKRK